MSDEIGGLLAAFDAATGLTDRRAAVEQAAARGQGLMLYELASALAGHIDDPAIPRQPYGGFARAPVAGARADPGHRER